MHNDPVALETSPAAHQIIKHKLQYDPTIPLLGKHTQEN